MGGASGGLAGASLELRNEKIRTSALPADPNDLLTIDEGSSKPAITQLDQYRASGHQDQCSCSDHPVNITNGPKGLNQIDSIHFWGLNLGKPLTLLGFEIASVSLYYYLFLGLVLVSIVICHRLQLSRIGRAWMAIREDEIAAKAMGINTRNLKLLAFGMGATFGGVSGSMFAAFQGFVSPESFSLMESIMIVAMVVLGGIGHLPGVILGAVLLSALPEVLRYVAGPLQAMTDGRLDAAILRQLLIALAMIIIMLWRPHGLWPAPDHGKSLQTK